MKLKWSTAEHFAPDIVKKLVAAGWPEDVLININFPDVVPQSVTGIEVTRQGKRDQSLVRVEERIDARNNPYYWLGFERILSNPPQGTDLRAIMRGAFRLRRCIWILPMRARPMRSTPRSGRCR